MYITTHTYIHTCNADIKECSLGTHNCAPQATCSDTNGSFTCTCTHGWRQRLYGVVCEDIDECLTANNSCISLNANCSNTQGSYTCFCDAGYIAHPVTGACLDVNECALNASNCHEMAQCNSECMCSCVLVLCVHNRSCMFIIDHVCA